MGGFDQVGANLRRAYEAGLDSVRAVRAEATATAAADQAADQSGADRGGPAGVEPHSIEPHSIEPHRVEPSGNRHSPVHNAAHNPAHISTHIPVYIPVQVPRLLRIAAAWAWRLIVIVVAVLVMLWILGKLELVVVPLAIALLLSALLSPAVGWLRRRRVHRSLATVIVMIGGLAAVVGTLTLVISQFIAGFPNLTRKSGEGVAKIQAWLHTGPLHLSDKQINSYVAQLEHWLQTNKVTFAAGALATAGTLVELAAGLLLVLFATFFFLRDGRRIARFLIGLLPGGYREDVASAADMSWSTLVSYVRATILVAFIDAVGIGLALVILRVDLVFPLAALVFLGAFIPIIGATLSGTIAVLVALVTQGPVVALLTVAAVIAVQQLEGHVLQPLIMGRAVAIHPLAVILAIATGAVLAGIVGALVAVPIVAVLNTAVRHLYDRRRLAELGQGPPGPPAPTGPPAPGASDNDPVVIG